MKSTKEGFRKEFREELMNNSMVLSFGICIIITGIFSMFYKSDNTLLVGIALSTLLLSIIQCFRNGNSLLNILPIITLFIFGFFHDSINRIPVLNFLLQDNYRNLVIYLAFGFSLFFHVFNNVRSRNEKRVVYTLYNTEKNKLFSTNFKVIGNMNTKLDNIKKIIEKNKINNKDLNLAIEEMSTYIEEETFLNSIKSNLIVKSNQDEEQKFDMDEVEESITQTYDSKNARKINAMMNTNLEIEE